MIEKAFLSEDRPEAILTAIYDAWADPLPNSKIRIGLSAGADQFSFTETQVTVTASYEKADKVLTSIQKKLGFRTFKLVEGLLCATAEDKSEALFQFLRYAFKKGTDVTEELSVPVVVRAFELNRKARNEAHLLVGFTRFSPLPGNIWFAKIGPINDVLPLIADHFVERFNTQAFMIYDEKRQRSVVYSPGANWYFLEGPVSFDAELPTVTDDFELLWKMYFDRIAIKERLNPICQRTLCPLHFREYMTEFHPVGGQD